MLKKTFIYFILCLGLNAKAQLGKEAWHWQFGQNVALDFSSGVPVAGISKINVHEGCASISNPKTGQLLFYTDGDSVWDRNNNRMPNGVGMINGIQGTTTQAATIVPKPGSSNVYYIITADYGSGNEPNQGVFYSVVDMNLNGGLGDVTIKNTLLTPPPTTEKVVATRHCNGVDYWILTHPYNSNNFNAYLVSSSGITTTPVVSSVGTIEQTVCCGDFESVGYMKISPNGRKLALCVESFSPSPLLEIFDFDNSTGQVSNAITIQCNFSGSYYDGPYGCSFSPDNSKLYVSQPGSSFTALLQFDLSSGIPSVIATSWTTIPSPLGICALQLAPNGKIYGCYEGYDSIAVINSPNNLGSACNFQSRALTLNGGTYCFEGFPNFIDAGLNGTSLSNFHDIIVCNGFTNDTADAGAGFVHYHWSTGDTTQKITINTSGTYWVNTTNSNGCISSDTLQAYIVSPSNLNILKDTVVCSEQGNYYANVIFNGITHYNWSDGTIMSSNIFTASGTYWVDYTLSGGCTIRDSFKLILNVKPTINLGRDTLYCGNLPQNIVLNPHGATNCTYYWSTTATSDSIIINSSGIYWVKVSSATNCFSYDTISITLDNTANPNILHDTSLCNMNQLPITLNGTIPVAIGTTNFYTWVPSHTGSTLTVNDTGIYILTVWVHDGSGNLLCKIKDTAYVSLGCANVNQFVNNNGLIIIYPNPNNGNFFIEYKIEQSARLEITDIRGNIISTYNIPANTNMFEIENDKLENGIYFYRIITKTETSKSQKLIIIK